MNVIFLVGNTGSDPISTYTTTGKLVVKFPFAVNRIYGEKEPDWFNVECWGKLAETMKEFGFLGQHLVILGSVRVETYDKDGESRFYNKVVANRIDIITWPESIPEASRIAPEPGFLDRALASLQF